MSRSLRLPLSPLSVLALLLVVACYYISFSDLVVSSEALLPSIVSFSVV